MKWKHKFIIVIIIHILWMHICIIPINRPRHYVAMKSARIHTADRPPRRHCVYHIHINTRSGPCIDGHERLFIGGQPLRIHLQCMWIRLGWQNMVCLILTPIDSRPVCICFTVPISRFGGRKTLLTRTIITIQHTAYTISLRLSSFGLVWTTAFLVRFDLFIIYIGILYRFPI